MPTVEFPLGEFLPDAPKQNNPGCVVANNCIPAEGGYKPFPQLVAASSAINGPVLGAELLFRNDTSPIIVGGSETRLFVRAGSTITQTTGLTALGPESYWDFAQFNDFVFATSLENAPQYLTDIDTDVSWSPLTGSPPKARYCERFADFLMLGNIENVPNRIQWSSFNDPAGSWAASRLTQAGFADLDPKLGDITGLVGGRYPMVFQRRGVSLLQYAGPPTVWRLDIVSEDRGCVAPPSIVTIGSQTFFLSQDGFYMTNGSEFAPIGSRRVNEWFFENVSQTEIEKTQGALDLINRCIVWSFVSREGNGQKDRAIIYSWEQNRFSTATLTVDWLVGSRVDPTTLEDLDLLFATLESVTPDLDSPVWRAGDRVLAAFAPIAGGSAYYTLNGSTMQADWETGAFQPAPGSRAMVTAGQGVFDATDWVMQMATISSDNTRSETRSGYSSPAVNGACPLRADGKEMRLAVRMPAGSIWRRAQGVQITFRGSGYR